MGTRNLSAAVIDGEYRVAKYCQWDGYPSGVGVDILNALTTYDLVELKNRIKKNSAFISNEKTILLYEDLGIFSDSGFISYEDSKRFSKKYPLLDRDTNLSDVFAQHMKINEDQPIYTKNSIDFAKDSLFCEWAYVVDFDKNTFEVYEGFNTDTPLTEADRFYIANEEDFYTSFDGTKYQPVRLAHSWSLDDLPSKEEFLNVLEPSATRM